VEGALRRSPDSLELGREAPGVVARRDLKLDLATAQSDPDGFTDEQALDLDRLDLAQDPVSNESVNAAIVSGTTANGEVAECLAALLVGASAQPCRECSVMIPGMPRATLSVRVQPRARSDVLVGLRDGAIIVRVSAPPLEGRANEAVRRLVVIDGIDQAGADAAIGMAIGESSGG